MGALRAKLVFYENIKEECFVNKFSGEVFLFLLPLAPSTELTKTAQITGAPGPAFSEVGSAVCRDPRQRWC